MKSKVFPSLDLTKICLNTLPGLIIGAALLFLCDAFSTHHLIKTVLSGAGEATGTGILLLILSSIVGLQVDSIFQTFVRHIGEIIWRPLGDEIKFRAEIMRDLGLDPIEFDGIFINKGASTNKAADQNRTSLALDDATELVRFAEVAGS
jgi:hypothetical protein